MTLCAMETWSEGNALETRGDSGSEKDATEIITFRLGGQEFGIAAADVDEVIAARKITRLPGLATHLDGVIHVHGVMVPVVALRNVLRVEGGGNSATRVLVVLQKDEMRVAFGAESIPELQWVPAAEQKTPTPANTPQYVSRMVQAGERWVMVLDSEKLVDLVNTFRGVCE